MIETEEFEYKSEKIPALSSVIRLDQPYGSFAKAMLGRLSTQNLLIRKEILFRHMM